MPSLSHSSKQSKATEKPDQGKRPFLTTSIIWGAVAFAILCVLYALNPSVSRLFPPCPLHSLTGLYCPGCGSLRATHLLLHGNFTGAFDMNPLMVLSLPILGLLVLRPRLAYLRWMPWAAFTVLIAYGIARNIPMWPFTLLAPR
jgi:hypothetical protein